MNPQVPEKTPAQNTETHPPPAAPTPVDMDQKPKNPFRFVWVFFFVILGLILVFYGILLVSLFGGYLNNPLFDILSIQPEDLKNVLIQVTNGLFGFLTLLFLLFAAGNIFRLVTLPKESPLRKSAIKRTSIFTAGFFLIFGTFIGLYIAISNAQTAKAVVQDNSLIKSFPADLRNLEAPIKVEFDIQERLKNLFGGTLDNVDQVFWDFDGDGEFDANGYQAQFKYSDKGEEDGVYQVKAKVQYKDENGESQIYETTRDVFIANVGVSAGISIGATEGFSPFQAEFSAQGSIDPDGEILKYEWDLDGDGEYEIEQDKPSILNRTFSRIGEHKIKLRVTGSQFDEAEIEQIITVTGGRPGLEAKITSEVGFEGFAPFVIMLSGADSFVEDGVITKYEWYLEGEKETYIQQRIRRVFREDGEFKIQLTVENDLGEKHRTTKIVKVKKKFGDQEVLIKTDPENPDPDEPLIGKVPFQVTFDATDSLIDGAIDWQWDFDDDGLADDFGQEVSKTYREPGRYVVHLTITNADGDEFEEVARINVEEAGLRPKIKADSLSGSVPLSIQFDGSGSSTDKGQIIDYIWEFPGEDPVHYSAQISYIFRNIGTFPVKLTIVDTQGRESTTETYISARPPVLIADFNMMPEAGYAPLEVQFDASPSQGVAVEYQWDFGDGKKARTFRPIHLYEDPGTYMVTLKMINDRGIISKSQKRITIKAR